MSFFDDPHANGRSLPVYADVMAELRKLEPGDSLEYYVDTRYGIRPCGALAAAWDAYEKGLVSLVQKRRSDGALVYLAVRI